MRTEDKAAFTPEFLRQHLKTMAGLDLSEGSAEMHELFAGLVALMNTLQPEGYAETLPAFTFQPMTAFGKTAVTQAGQKGPGVGG